MEQYWERDWGTMTLTIYKELPWPTRTGWLWSECDTELEDDDPPDAYFPTVLREADGTVPDYLVLPAHPEICKTCEGRGRHVNPSIDGQGLDPHDPDLDESFWADYWSGGFDVQCKMCDSGKVLRLSQESSDPRVQAVREALESYYTDLYESEAIEAQERACGA